MKTYCNRNCHRRQLKTCLNSEGDGVTDLHVCDIARLGGQVCPREVWLHVQTVSCDDGQIGSSSTGPRPVREETSVFPTWSYQQT